MNIIQTPMIEIYTDGSTKGNGTDHAVGGWAYLILQDNVEQKRDSFATFQTTNQRMELLAAIHALKDNPSFLSQPITIYSDSAYLINCVQQEWWKNWQKNGWLNSKKQPVANADLWTLLIPYFQMTSITWSKVKGHAGDKYNEIVDTMAQSSAQLLLSGGI